MDEWWFTDWQLPPTWWCSHGTPPLRNQWGWFIRLWSNNVRQRNDDPKGQSPIPLQKVQVMWSSEAWHNGWWNHWSRCLFGSTFSASLEFPFLQAAVNFSWRCRSLIPKRIWGTPWFPKCGSWRLHREATTGLQEPLFKLPANPKHKNAQNKLVDDQKTHKHLWYWK